MNCLLGGCCVQIDVDRVICVFHGAFVIMTSVTQSMTHVLPSYGHPAQHLVEDLQTCTGKDKKDCMHCKRQTLLSFVAPP